MIHIRIVPKHQVHKNFFSILIYLRARHLWERNKKKSILFSIFYPLKMIYSIRKLPIPNCIKLKLSATQIFFISSSSSSSLAKKNPIYFCHFYAYNKIRKRKFFIFIYLPVEICNMCVYYVVYLEIFYSYIIVNKEIKNARKKI